MGRVTKDSVYEQDLFTPLIKQVNEAIVVIDKMTQSTLKEAEALNKVSKSFSGTSKSQRELFNAEKKSKKLVDEKIKADQKRAKLSQQLTQVNNQQRKSEAELRTELQRRNKLAREEAKLTNQNFTAREKLNFQIKRLSEQYQNLFIQEGKETKQTRKLKAQILALNKVRNQANENLGRHQHKVGQYQNAVGKLRGALAQLGLAFGVFAILRNTFSVITTFDEAVTNLGAISGKTAEEIEPLKQQALDLGATTQYTAAQISGLQIELAKLGFTVDEISQSTGPIANFATATGADLADAAALGGSALRAFGLDASEMERVVSVLGVATTKTALDFNFLQTAMSTIAPVAKAFGFSIEDTTALLGQLANSGFDASSAATATRNILLNLADANGALAKALGHPVTSADELAGALVELKGKGVDLATALELTDKRSVAAFNTFLDGADSLVGLRDSITDVSGELNEMSAKKLDSISGATDLLKSAWEGLILEWNEGEGAGESIKEFLLFLAKNLPTIVKTVLTLVKAFLAYKTAMFLANKANIVFEKSVKKLGGPQGLGLILAAIGLIITAVFELIDVYSNAAKAGAALEEANRRVNEQLDVEISKLDLVVGKILNYKNGTEGRKQAIDELNATYGTTLQNLEDETLFLRELESAYRDVVNQMTKRIQLQVVEQDLVTAVAELRKLERQLETEGDTFGVLDASIDFYKREIDSLKKEMFLLQQDEVNLADMRANLRGEAEGLIPGDTTSGGKDDPEVKAEKEKLDKLNALKKKHNEELLQMENDLIAAGVDRDIVNQRLFEREVQQRREQGELIIELDFKDTEILKKHRNDYLKFVEQGEVDLVKLHEEANLEITDDDLKAFQLRQQNHQKHLDIMAEKERKLWNDIRKDISDTAKFAEQFYQNRISRIDSEIEKQQMLFDDHKSQEQELKDIAKEKGLDATQSIEAEREAQKKALAAQQELANKKQQIEATLVALRILAARIEQGDGNPVSNVKQQITDVIDFAKGLTKFRHGTDTIVAKEYGKPQMNGEDGYIARFDGREKILSPEWATPVANVPQADLVNGYLSYANGLSAKSMIEQFAKNATNTHDYSQEIVEELRNLQKIKQNDSTEMVFNSTIGVLEYTKKQGKKVNRYRYKA